MSPEEFETCWVPVPLRWRHVVVGDVIVGKGQSGLWSVQGISAGGCAAGVTLVNGASTYDSGPGPGPGPDEVVQVLTPVPMAQAVALTREQIGMQLIARRETAEGVA